MSKNPSGYDCSSCPPTRVLLARLGLAWGLASGVAVAAFLLGGWVGG